MSVTSELDLEEFLRRMEREPVIVAILARLEAELSPSYSFHSPAHTRDVMAEAVRFGHLDGLSEAELRLIAVAAAFHDAGYMFGAQGHEAKSAVMAVEAMQKDGSFSDADITMVRQMILDTHLQETGAGQRQYARTGLSGYLLDADLSNFGRDDFFERLAAYTEELKANPDDLGRTTLALMRRHDWVTEAARSLREAKKQANMAELAKRLDRSTNA